MRPLDGVRVVDLTHFVAGPYCTRMLADYGADVIKIEQPPAGDPARRIGPFQGDEPHLEKSGLFLFLNTNKRSMTLNLKTRRGVEIFFELVKDADVVVENFAPGAMSSLGLSYDVLYTVNPRVVLTSISNFGQSGPYRDWEGIDLTLFAMGGNMIGSGDPELEPVKTAGRMVSYHVGYAAALATLVALEKVELTGAGGHVDVSFFEVLTHSIDGRLGWTMAYQYSKKLVERRSAASTVAVGSGIYPCLDGFFMISAGPARFDDLARMIGAEAILDDPKWNTVSARTRREAAEEFDAVLIPWLLERTKREILGACIENGVLGAPMNTIEDLVNDPHFRDREYFQDITHPIAGTLKYPGYQIRIHDGETVPPRHPAPLLGQDTSSILREMGYQVEDIGRLREQRVI